MQWDIKEVASLLDETIEKGLPKKSKIEQIEEDIVKGLSFDPMEPILMTADSPYHNPYLQLQDGSFAPHPEDYWIGQGKDASAYDTTRQFYRDAGVTKSFKEGRKALADLSKSMFDYVIKGAAVPVGTVHEFRDGKKYRKIAEGQWLPVTEGRGGMQKPQQTKPGQKPQPQQAGQKPEQSESDHQGIERHASQTQSINQALKNKQAQRQTIEAAKKETIKEVLGHVKEHMGKLYDGDMPKDMAQGLDDKIKDASNPLPTELHAKVKKLGKGEGREIHLKKDELNTLLKSGKFALISAGLNPEKEREVAARPSMRNADAPRYGLKDAKHSLDISARYEKLRGELVDSGYAFTKVKGHYGGEEDSYLVMVHDHDEDHIKQLGKKFNQDSVIVSEQGKHKMIYTTGPKAESHHEGEGHKEVGDDQKDFYSEVDTPEGKVKFALNLDFKKLNKPEPKKEPEPEVTSTEDMHKQINEEIEKQKKTKKHHVHVSFKMGNKEYTHHFKDVESGSHSEASEKVQSALKKKFPGAMVNRIKAERAEGV